MLCLSSISWLAAQPRHTTHPGRGSGVVTWAGEVWVSGVNGGRGVESGGRNSSEGDSLDPGNRAG